MSVLTYLKKSVDLYPDKTALTDENRSLTYRQLDDLSDVIASELIRRISTINRPVTVMIDRNVESLVSFMGIVKSHNFYMPADCLQPVNRLMAMIQQMEPACIIAFNNCPEEIRERTDIPVYEYDELITGNIESGLVNEAEAAINDDDPLYLMCTSGSTGIPKGVLITHGCVEQFIPVFVKTFGFTGDDVFGNQAPFDFDVSVKDFYSMLYCGASMVIIPKKCFSMPKLLVELLDDQQVTVIIWAVSALCIVSSLNALKHRVPSKLRKILFSGEVMPVRMLNVWRNHLPEAMYVNLYGPTEITCNCMYYIIDRDFRNEETLPLGQNFDNCTVMMLNDRNRIIGVGEEGEICVCGPSVSPGYYHDHERTGKAFVPDPFNGAIMYRTGDLAHLAEDGCYYFSGRKDFQIKHMGHRIELEEIEKHLNNVEGVTRAICMFDEKRNKITAVYQGEADRKDIIASLKDDLPKYMIPSVYYREDDLPLNKNGKIDRKLLKEKYL